VRTSAQRFPPAAALAVIIALLALARDGGAGEAKSSLDDLIAIATQPRLASSPSEFPPPDERVKAIRKISDLPTDTLEDEAKIVTALQQLRKSPDANVINAALRALGRRNHQELLPELFAEAADGDELAADRVRSFVLSLPEEPPPGNPPLELLRQGLESSSPHFRRVVAEFAEKFKAQQLRPELEKLVVGDADETVRMAAAMTLSKLECRESLPALRAGFRGSEWARKTIGGVLAQFGSDQELELLTPLLASSSAETREAIARSIGNMPLGSPLPAGDALLPLLKDKSRKVRLAAAVALGRLKDARAVPGIREILNDKRTLESERRRELIAALKSIGDETAVGVLNERVLDSDELIGVLLELGHPSSGYALWDAYLTDPIALKNGENNAGRKHMVLRGLEKLGDSEVFRAIRLRIAATVDASEKHELEIVATQLAARFPEVAAEPLDAIKTSAATKPSDRDKDGVPDRLDKYPDDDRRSEDIPVKEFESPLQIPATFYVTIPLADEGPASKNVLFMALDDDNRTGWITRANDTDPTDYHVASWSAGERDEWPLPNPGDTPGIHRLDPASVNSRGTVVGAASRKKIALPLRQNVREAHVTFQSGFIFEQGKLRFDPPPPFAGEALNVSYRRINNHGVIFGHREMRLREGGDDVFRTFAFLGDHLFRDVPAFDVTAMTDAGQLLCWRVKDRKLESFVWDAAQFHALGSLAGKSEAVRAYAINQKLQIVGLSDALDKERCPIGFFWENGRMRAFTELIPEEFRPHLRSAIPYLISDSGSITFRAEEKAGPFPQFWPKRNFLLQLGEGGNNSISLQLFNSAAEDD